MKSSGKRIQLAATILVSVLALTACGGGGSSSAGNTGAAVTQGVVTAKAAGSVTVNGVQFSTAGATVKIDDNPSAADLLQLGMTVKVNVTGGIDDNTKTGVAHDIEARDALEGQITAVGANTITIMGQTVQIEDNVTRLNDDNTVKTFAAAGFAVGNFVEVHGFADDQGGLRATRAAIKVSGEFESKGFVTGLGASSFGLSRIAGGTPFVTVNFSTLPAEVVNGSLVEVKSVAAPVAGAITATLIHLEDKLGAAGVKVETEGLVSSGTLASFVVNGQQVVTDASTVFEGGLSTDFAIGVKLEAEGPLNAAGAIVASKITFRSNIKIEGDASAVTATSLVVLGKTIAINQFTNGTAVNGNHVEVRATTDRDGNLLATRIVVLGASAKAILQAPVSAFDGTAGTLTILGSPLVSDGATQWRVSSTVSDVPVSKAAFFAQVKANISVVKVRWDNFTALTAPIKEAEIELGK